MKIFDSIRAWFRRQKFGHPPAELEIYTSCYGRTHYIVWEPKGYRCETFDTLADAKKYAERMGWRLV